MPRPVLLATCAALPDGDEDADVLNAALAERRRRRPLGAVARPEARLDDELVVLRSTWDYTDRPAEFLAWVAGLPRVLNPAEVVAWNTDKMYLRDLAEAGVPTVPTAFAAPGEAIEFARACRVRGQAVGRRRARAVPAGSPRTRSAAARRHVAAPARRPTGWCSSSPTWTRSTPSARPR